MRSPGSRRLGQPVSVRVHATPEAVPLHVEDAAVDSILEEWAVENGWWTGRPLRRRYFELVLADGRNEVVCHDLSTGRWYRQRD